MPHSISYQTQLPLLVPHCWCQAPSADLSAPILVPGTIPILILVPGTIPIFATILVPTILVPGTIKLGIIKLASWLRELLVPGTK